MADESKRPAPSGSPMVSEVELLSTTVGQIEGKTNLIMSFRTDPTRSFRSMNFGISKAQARRLYDDLTQLFQTSHLLNEPDGTEPPKKKRTRKPKNK